MDTPPSPSSSLSLTPEGLQAAATQPTASFTVKFDTTGPRSENCYHNQWWPYAPPFYQPSVVPPWQRSWFDDTTLVIHPTTTTTNVTVEATSMVTMERYAEALMLWMKEHDENQYLRARVAELENCILRDGDEDKKEE